jgi:hypothetical protein
VLYYIASIIPQSFVLLHSSFRILGPDPNIPGMIVSEIESHAMFFWNVQVAVTASIGKVPLY